MLKTPLHRRKSTSSAGRAANWQPLWRELRADRDLHGPLLAAQARVPATRILLIRAVRRAERVVHRLEGLQVGL